MLNALLREIRESSGNVIISTEVLLGYDVGVFVNHLHDMLSALDFNIELIVAPREYFARASSVYNQRVKDSFHFEKRGPNEFLVEEARHLCYAPDLRRLSTIGCRIRLVSYSPADTFVPRFLDAVGWRTEEPVVAEKRNVSLSMRGMIAVLAANMTSDSVGDRKVAFEHLRKMRGFFAPSEFIFRADAVQSASAVFSEDRRYLKETFDFEISEAKTDELIDHFYINEQDLEAISTVVRPIGELGDRIVACASKFRIDG